MLVVIHDTTSFLCFHFFLAILRLLTLKGDSVAVEQKVANFNNLDYTFSASRENIFISKLVKVKRKFADCCTSLD